VSPTSLPGELRESRPRWWRLLRLTAEAGRRSTEELDA